MVSCFRVLVAVGVLAASAVAAAAQPPRDVRLLVTVVDQTSAVIPDAVVTVIGLDEPTKAARLAPARTSDKGVATLENLLAGRYAIQAEFPGFDPGRLDEVRLRRGDNRLIVTLTIGRLETSVSVGQDPQAAAADPRGNSFRVALAPEEIGALSDDPDELRQQLMDMAGGSAVIRVDSFMGAPLPPKAQIKSVHIVRDAFAAENHSAESEGIDIITQPGTGPLRGGASSRFRDGSMSARSPFTPTKGPERSQVYDFNVGGTIVENKASFSIGAGSRRQFDTPTLYVALPGGQRRAEVLGLKRPNDSWFLHGLFDLAITRNHMLRAGYDWNSSGRRNLGVGAYDLVERAYASTSSGGEIRLVEVGPIGRRMFVNSRLQLEWTDNRSRAALEAPTIRVQDAFTSGGAQVGGGRRARVFEAASDVDYVRGLHTIRTGVLIEGGRYRSDDASNYLGTYTFASLEDFDAKRPAQYTRRIGNPLVEYWFVRSGVYIQDDLRVRKNLTLSPGLRYEAQTHLRDYGNVGPRFGLTWSPGRNGRTTVRASWGVFYNWLNQGTYEQTLRVDGLRQRELNIVNPSYPDPGVSGSVGATNKYLLGDMLQMGRVMRVSAGVDRTLSPHVRVNVTYSATRGAHVLHGVNLNAPVGGVRPDARFANVIATVSDARSDNEQLSAGINVNFAPGRVTSQPLWNWRRLTTRFTYWIAESHNNAEGAFSVSPTGTLATEWAPAGGDRRHRVTASINSQALRNLNASFNFSANSGNPYNITTGHDDNGDSLFNDRPASVGRNTARTASQWTWNGNASYSIRMGGRAAGASQDDRRAPAQAAARYRLTFNVSVSNLTNHFNYAGFSGVMTSPFFMQPTAVANPRKVDLSVSFGF